MLKRDIATWTRWLHIYLSMFSFAALLFFAVTGITLNHPDAFTGTPLVTAFSGKIDPKWVAGTDSIQVAKLELVEYLRNQHRIKAPLKDFLISDTECAVSFKGPAYTADAFVDRQTGTYELTITQSGWVAVMNDLHKGRDTGNAWVMLIDVSAGLMILVSLTGFLMIFFLKKKTTTGLLTFLAGVALLIIIYLLL